MEGPREERFQPAERVKVRTSGDGAVGWISVKTDAVKRFSPFYKFLKAAKLFIEKGFSDVVREVISGEIVELHEGPIEVDGKMWMRGQMKKDAAVGWVPLKDEDGAKVVVCTQ